MPVDDWVAAKTTGWQSDVIRKVIAAIGKAAPRATSAIKWSMPVS